MYKDFAYQGEKALFLKNVEEIEKVVIGEGFEYEFKINETEFAFEKKDGLDDIIYAGVNSYSESDTQAILQVTTKEGPIKAFGWKSNSDTTQLKKFAENASIVEITGKWNEFPKGSGKFSFQISNIEESNESVDNVLPFVKDNGDMLVKELFYYISMMSEDKQELAKGILLDVWEDFKYIPAAKGMHHHKFSGLLQHTVENLRIANTFINAKNSDELLSILDKSNRFLDKILYSEFKKYNMLDQGGRFFSSYKDGNSHKEFYTMGIMEAAYNLEKENDFQIDKDIVIFSTLFHDIGKIMEYTYSGASNARYDIFFPGFKFSKGNKSTGADVDVHGIRLGHITLGVMFLTRKFQESGFTDGDFLMDVLSCISAHHGRLDWGSLTVPQTVEEYVVHIADYIGSRLGSENLY